MSPTEQVLASAILGLMDEHVQRTGHHAGPLIILAWAAGEYVGRNSMDAAHLEEGLGALAACTADQARGRFLAGASPSSEAQPL